MADQGDAGSGKLAAGGSGSDPKAAGRRKDYGVGKQAVRHFPSSSPRAEARWVQAMGISFSLMELKPSRKMSSGAFVV